MNPKVRRIVTIAVLIGMLLAVVASTLLGAII